MPGLGRRFQPGQSGNKAGRPRQDKSITELARQHAPAAIKTLVEVMKSEKSTMTARAIAPIGSWIAPTGKRHRLWELWWGRRHDLPRTTVTMNWPQLLPAQPSKVMAAIRR